MAAVNRDAEQRHGSAGARRASGGSGAMSGPPCRSKSFPVFDCDSHVVEPPAIWDEYVPSQVRAWVKTQFHFHTDTDVLLINGRAVPASRERANAAEVGWPGWSKKEVGALTPGT